MEQNDELLNLIKANVKVIQIISYETLRIHAMLVNAAEKLERSLYIWNRIEGVRKWVTSPSLRAFVDEDTEAQDPNSALDFFKDKEKKIIFLLEDFHPDLTEDKPRNIKTIRNITLSNNRDKTLIFSQPFVHLPRELEKEVHIMELPYPHSADIEAIYGKVCKDYTIPNSGKPDHELIEAALGLTIMEAEKAFALAYIENNSLTGAEVPLVIREKENVIKKSGYLEYYHPKEEMKDVGGLDNLKDWLIKRGRGFDKGAADFGLTYPRGILLLGIPGTGKSLTAKAIGNLWHFPLLRLDMGKIFGGIVGESEKNIREALNIAEAIAPSILWIDEIEKGMSGIASSGSTDGGTTSRVLGTFLTWMQEKTKPVFVVATANDISQLPPELLRKGRVDEVFFVDLPSEKEREEIIGIHLRKKNRNAEDFDVGGLALKSKGFSGAELEEVVKEALFQAYDKEREVRNEDILEAIGKTFPLSRTMHETIDKMRLWAKSRAVAASSEEPEVLDKGKDGEVPKLKQETYQNPFIG
ncbi:MAG: AAA family ATPase [Treponema sp.]|jgi:AAA+ superfamily predicted ATPase|nr:AAA family ATPase [Treponema sp.]